MGRTTSGKIQRLNVYLGVRRMPLLRLRLLLLSLLCPPVLSRFQVRSSSAGIRSAAGAWLLEIVAPQPAAAASAAASAT
jgi:hypothetical protein